MLSISRSRRRIRLLILPVLVLGLIMLVTPGPAIVVIPVGLAILSIEFTWARAWLKRLRESISYRSTQAHAGRAEKHRDRVSGK